MTRLFFLTLTLACAICLTANAPAHAQSNFIIYAPTFEEGAPFPRANIAGARGCTGENISPALQWSGAPAQTRSFVVTLYDPETRNGVLHWAVFNIPADVGSLGVGVGSGKLGALPQGARALPNSFGNAAYDGPCPPEGQTRHYEFTVFAMPEGYAFYPLSAVGQPTMRWLREKSLAQATMTIKFAR